MARLGVRRSPVKARAAVAAERLGRLKPNGHLVHRPPLSDLVELDALTLGAQAKRQLWESLRDLADVDDALARADAQLAALEPLRLEARKVLTASRA
jgi:hypothetical protein